MSDNNHSLMSEATTQTRIPISEATDVLMKLYGINGSLTHLPGEVDFNFKVQSNDQHYILKISRANEDFEILEFQQQLLLHIENHAPSIIAPRIIKDKNGKLISSFIDRNENIRLVRLLTWVPGRIWSDVNPQLDSLRLSLGEYCGLVTDALKDFNHEKARRTFEWDIAQVNWVNDQLHLFSGKQKQIVLHFMNLFNGFQDTYSRLRKTIVHNDANDNNILVTEDLKSPRALALIDYGDAIRTQVINDVAIACAYAIMHHTDPLEAALPIVKGYHSRYPLQEEELRHLYNCIALRLVISVTKSAINKNKEPDNEYLLISEKPAWALLEKWYLISPEFARYCFRDACGFNAHPGQDKFSNWASSKEFCVSDLFPTINRNKLHTLDLSVSSKWIGHKEDFNDLDLFQFKIKKLQKQLPNKIIAGGYLEPRPIYTSTEYDKIGNHGRESRTIHLGVDFWLPAYTKVHALHQGEVVTATNNDGDKEYGGLVILKHKTEAFEFFTLYGHLSVASATKHRIGDIIKKGEEIAELGDSQENGNWAPHLHFQVMLSLLDYEMDFPGVCYPKQIAIWKSLCPNPNVLFKSKVLDAIDSITNDSLINFRKQHLGKSLSLQYSSPIKMVRGDGQYLLDPFGKKYLDTVNNVAHVGHEHYNIVKAGREQMALINTNSRYLHGNINDLAKELLKTLPEELSVLHFVNSGSEANELAIRMAKVFTGEKDIIVSEAGYHGNTNICVDISSYKFDGSGGNGAPEHTHVFPLPDAFRGTFRGNSIGASYAQEVKQQIMKVQDKGRSICAFIIEPIISCGGQVELPQGFLQEAYTYIREAGGLCISDEVQTGCGRMGTTFWGFQLHNVVPDIVTIGKPLGNGHPVAAVACTQEVAEKFANGMEFFNTFGGNPVSCAIATEVLRTVQQEKLQENALHTGHYLKEELVKLSKEFPIIGDIRGQGLFLGIELVDHQMNPLAEQTDYLVNRMLDQSILMSSDGPDHNVLKIKPPMVFSKENADELLLYLRKILSEDFMTSYATNR